MNKVDEEQNPSGQAVNSPLPAQVEGYWPVDDARRIFVEGAKWWEFHSRGATMWPSDQRDAEDEADKRFPNGVVPPRMNVSTGEHNVTARQAGSDQAKTQE